MVSSLNELSTPPGTYSETRLTSNTPTGNSVSQSQVSFLPLKAGFANVSSSPIVQSPGHAQAIRDAQGFESSVSGTQKAVSVLE